MPLNISVIVWSPSFGRLSAKLHTSTGFNRGIGLTVSKPLLTLLQFEIGHAAYRKCGEYMFERFPPRVRVDRRFPCREDPWRAGRGSPLRAVTMFPTLDRRHLICETSQPL